MISLTTAQSTDQGISICSLDILTVVIQITQGAKPATFPRKKGKKMTLEQMIEAKGFYLYPHTGKVLKATDVVEWVIEQMQAGNIKPAATRGEE